MCTVRAMLLVSDVDAPYGLDVHAGSARQNACTQTMELSDLDPIPVLVGDLVFRVNVQPEFIELHLGGIERKQPAHKCLAVPKD